MYDVALQKKIGALVVLLIVICTLSLCISVDTDEVYGLDVAAHAIDVWAQTTFATLFQGGHFTTVDLAQMEPRYFQVMARITTTFIMVLCGIVLTVSGSIYQSVFQNPIAAPTMLGVNSGLNLGLIALVLVYGEAALAPSALIPHYLFAYGGAILVLAIVLGFSYLMNGPRAFNVVDLLLIGSIASMMIGQIVLFVSYQVFTDQQWLVYTELNEVMTVQTAAEACLFLVVAFVATFSWVVAFRFRFNALSFTDEESRGFGVDGTRMRYLGILLATIMIIAALAHSGMVGMASLIVPFMSRAFFGAEFRKQLIGNILIGAVLVVFCRDVASLLTIALHNMGLLFDFPIGIVASLVCMPMFVWIIATKQRTWE